MLRNRCCDLGSDRYSDSCNFIQTDKKGGRVEKTVEEMVKDYVSIRDGLVGVRADFKKSEAQYKNAMANIETKIMEAADAQGVTSFKTPHGTAFKVTKETYNVANWDAALDFIIENDLRHFLTKKVSTPAVKEYMAENNNVQPPGLSPFVKVEINVRRS